MSGERCKNCGTFLKDLVLFTSTTKYCPRCEEPTVPNHTLPKPGNKSTAGTYANPYTLNNDKDFDDLCKELERLLDEDPTATLSKPWREEQLSSPFARCRHNVADCQLCTNARPDCPADCICKEQK